MKRINKGNKFLIIWLTCVFLLICVCNLSFFKDTWSAFGDLTGQLTVPYTISYISNYPEELNLNEDDKEINFSGNTYTIMANDFILAGYEFVNWNTLKDGTGNVYNPNDVITIDKNLTFYAQWKKLEIIEISYGDINLDGIVNNNDYLLLEEYVTLGTGIDELGLSNADVNVDGKIDLVDVDIIKQVCLGTEGYIGMLPNNPILVYEVYNNNSEPESGTDVNDGNISGDEDNKDGEDSNLENGDSSSDGNDDSSSDNSGSSSANSSSSASGNASNEGSSNNAGTGSESKPSSGSSSKPGNDNSSSNSGNDHGNSSSNEIENEDLLNNSTDNFIDDIITGEQSANKDEVNELQILTKPNNVYVAIIVLGIFLLAIRLVIYVINKFRQKEKNI